MDTAHQELRITIPTTPKELREAADFIQSQMETKNVGDRVPEYHFFGKELRVSLQADSTAYYQHKSGTKSSWV